MNLASYSIKLQHVFTLAILPILLAVVGQCIVVAVLTVVAVPLLVGDVEFLLVVIKFVTKLDVPRARSVANWATE